MLNPKETLQKIAEALNIVAKDETAAVEPVAEVPTPEPAVEPVAEVPAVEPVVPEAPEPEVVPEVVAEPVVSDREAELAKQVEDLKGILAEAMKQPEAPAAEPAEPKGLTHSPEAVVKQGSGRGVGNKGGTIQERVFKYINN